MKISEMLAALSNIQQSYGDINIYCGSSPVAGFAVLPEATMKRYHVLYTSIRAVSILTRRTDEDAHWRP